MFVYLSGERERAHAHVEAGEGQREKERERESQADSVLSVQSSMWGSNPRTVRS